MTKAAKKRMSMAQWEKSPQDAKLDKQHPELKEGSKAEQAKDRKELAKHNRSK